MHISDIQTLKKWKAMLELADTNDEAVKAVILAIENKITRLEEWARKMWMISD